MDPRIVQAVGGDGDALAQLLFHYHDQLHAFVRGRIGKDIRTVVDPADILQEVYCGAFRSIASFRPKTDKAFFNWLTSIARNRLRDAGRGQGAKKRGGEHKRVEKSPAGREDSYVDLLNMLSAGISTPGSRVSRAEAIRALQVRLAALPEDYRQVIQLHHIDGHSLEEVAERMERTVGQVRGLLPRARQKLHDAMGSSSLWFSKK